MKFDDEMTVEFSDYDFFDYFDILQEAPNDNADDNNQNKGNQNTDDEEEDDNEEGDDYTNGAEAPPDEDDDIGTGGGNDAPIDNKQAAIDVNGDNPTPVTTQDPTADNNAEDQPQEPPAADTTAQEPNQPQDTTAATADNTPAPTDTAATNNEPAPAADTGEDQTDYATDANPPDDTEMDAGAAGNDDLNADNTNNDVRTGDAGADTGSPADNDDAGEDQTDYTAGAEAPGDEPTDDAGGDNADADTQGDTETDTEDNSGDNVNGGAGDEEINQLQSDTFSNLTEEQLRIRINKIKESFINLYVSIEDTIEKLSSVNKGSDNLNAINFINDTLFSLKTMVRDALTDSFNQRSIIENQILLERFVASFAMVNKFVEHVSQNKDNNNKKENN